MKKLFNGFYNRKRVLITGDSGFKGSWLAIWLKELGAEVFGYSLPPKTLRDNFVKCGLKSKVNHEDGDVRDREHMQKYFNEIKPEIAFHLAAQPLVLESYKNPHYTFETNLMGVVNFFEAVRGLNSVKAAVNITSDKCYQNNEWIWGYRESDAMGGKDPYSSSKGCSELITNAYTNSFFKDNSSCFIASARAGNVIGGGDWAENRIVPDFFRAVEKKEILKIRYPNATRPWQHVLEPLGGYLLLGSKLLSEGKIFSGGWNFGPFEQNNFSVKELIKKIIEVGKVGEFIIEKEFEKKHEASLLKLDISKAINLLRWSPVLNFNETVKMTVDGYEAENISGNLYCERVKQIKEYLEIGREKGIEWVRE